jgi:hypothetical protein
LSFTAKAASQVTVHSEFNGGYGGNAVVNANWSRYEIAVKRNNANAVLFIWPTTANIHVCIKDIQLEKGSTATEYQPHYHSTTPIQLPSRGWVGSLPDGTHDALSIDGAGKVTWELADAMTNAAATEGVTGTVGVDVLSTTGEIADGATVLYKTTPTTEVMGYVDLPDIPEGAVVSMPELEGLGVESWTSDAVARYVRAWAARS